MRDNCAFSSNPDLIGFSGEPQSFSIKHIFWHPVRATVMLELFSRFQAAPSKLSVSFPDSVLVVSLDNLNRPGLQLVVKVPNNPFTRSLTMISFGTLIECAFMALKYWICVVCLRKSLTSSTVSTLFVCFLWKEFLWETKSNLTSQKHQWKILYIRHTNSPSMSLIPTTSYLINKAHVQHTSIWIHRWDTLYSFTGCLTPVKHGSWISLEGLEVSKTWLRQTAPLAGSGPAPTLTAIHSPKWQAEE